MSNTAFARCVREPLVAAVKRSRLGRWLTLPGTLAAIAGLYWIHTRLIRYEHEVLTGDLKIALLVVLVAIAHLVPGPRRMAVLLAASLAWQLAFTSPLLAGATILSAAGVYHLVRRSPWSWWVRHLCLVPLVTVFVGSTWAGAARQWTGDWSLIPIAYSLGWGTMVMRLAYFIAEGPQLRRGVEGDHLGAYLVFLLFFPFTLYIILMSYVEFVRSHRREPDLSLTVRGLEIMLVGMAKHLCFFLFLHLTQKLRMAQGAGMVSGTGNAIHFWCEVCLSYLRAYLLLSAEYDLCTGWARIFGFDIAPSFRNPLMARNMKEVWVRWNVFLRQGLVNLCYYPLVRRLGRVDRPARQCAALLVACVLTFLLSAGVHRVFSRWPSTNALTYFLLQALPVSFVLLREYLLMHRARRLRRRPPAPDPLFTPLFVAITFVYQSVIHHCFATVEEIRPGEAFRLFVALPVQLMQPFFGRVGYSLFCLLVAVGLARRLLGRRREALRANLATPALATIAALAFAWVTWPAVRSPLVAAGTWAARSPMHIGWMVNEGLGWAQRGDSQRAIDRFRWALRRDPKHVFTSEQLAMLLYQRGEIEAALTEGRRLIEVMPESATAHMAFARLLNHLGRTERVLWHLREARRLEPDNPGTHCNLALILTSERRYAEAIRVLREGLTRCPNDAAVGSQLAWLLATCPEEALRDGQEGLRLAERVCRDTGATHAVSLDVLAAAYAEVGRFEDAARTATRARGVAMATRQAGLAKEISSRLEGYRAGRPYRLPE